MDSNVNIELFLRRSARKFHSILVSNRILTLIEQAFLSFSNFFATLLLARSFSKDVFGVFTLAYTIFLFLQGFQRAIINIPIVVFSPTQLLLRESGLSWRKIQAGLTGIFIIVIFLAQVVSSFILKNIWLSDTLWIVLLILLPLNYYEFLRRWLIQEGLVSVLVPMAFIYSVVYILGVFIITRFTFPIIYAGLTLALAGFFATSIGICRSGVYKNCRLKPINTFIAEIWSFSKWAILSHLAYAGYNSLIQILLTFSCGPAASAIFSATRVVGQPVQTLIMAIDSVDKPKASFSLYKFGLKGMMTSLKKTSLVLILIGGTYIAAIGLLAKPVIRLLYKGAYDDNVISVYLWLAIFFIMLIGQPLESGLYVLKTSDKLFFGRVFASIAGLSTAFFLIPKFETEGALLALLLGWTVSSVIAFIQLKNEAKHFL